MISYGRIVAFGEGIAEAMAEAIGDGMDGIEEAMADAIGDGIADVDGIVCARAMPVTAPAIAQPARTIPVNKRFTVPASLRLVKDGSTAGRTRRAPALTPRRTGAIRHFPAPGPQRGEGRGSPQVP